MGWYRAPSYRGKHSQMWGKVFSLACPRPRLSRLSPKSLRLTPFQGLAVLRAFLHPQIHPNLYIGGPRVFRPVSRNPKSTPPSARFRQSRLLLYLRFTERHKGRAVTSLRRAFDRKYTNKKLDPVQPLDTATSKSCRTWQDHSQRYLPNPPQQRMGFTSPKVFI